MKALFHLNVDFVAWSAHIAAGLARHVGEGFTADAVVTLDAGTAGALRGQSFHRFGVIDCLIEHEPSWLAARDGRARLATISGWLGSEQVREIGIADREISGFATPHARFAETPLKRATQDENARAAYLAGLIAHLDAMLERGGYDVIIATSVQDAPGVALAHLADRRGVPFLSPKAIGYGQMTALFDDARNMRPVFRKRFHGLVTKDEAKAVADGVETLAAFRARPKPPDYMASPINSPFGWPRLIDSAALLWRAMRRRKPENLRYPYPLARLKQDWSRAIGARLAVRSALFHPASTLFGQNFIYFPLHYEPEASLLVSAPHETDQIALIERLHAGLPVGWLLAVKEHRPMLGRRPAGFYGRLARMPHVRLISAFEDGFSVIRAARLTATITGTAGLESVLLGQPTLFFADHPIQVVGAGFARASSGESASASIHRALAEPPADDTRLAAFLTAIAAEGLDFPSAKIWNSLQLLPFEELSNHRQAVDRMVELILMALKRG